jgi:hypothetical protein
MDHSNKRVQRQDLFWCIRSCITSLKSMQNTYSYQLNKRDCSLQDYIYTSRCIWFFLLPSYNITWNSITPDVRQASTIGQFQVGLGSITLPVQSQV